MKIGKFATALCLMMSVSTPALADDFAVAQTAVTLPPNGFLWEESETDATSLVTVIVSIPDQRAYVYRGATLIAASTVSTGRKGKETPIGTYQILQKKVEHRSSLYNAAEMPFMQRLTWDGIAIHAGKNPGFPNSHGCIRLPTAFAQKLFAATTLGTTVTVTGDATYYEPSADLQLLPG